MEETEPGNRCISFSDFLVFLTDGHNSQEKSSRDPPCARNHKREKSRSKTYNSCVILSSIDDRFFNCYHYSRTLVNLELNAGVENRKRTPKQLLLPAMRCLVVNRGGCCATRNVKCEPGTPPRRYMVLAPTRISLVAPRRLVLARSTNPVSQAPNQDQWWHVDESFWVQVRVVPEN